MLIHKKQIRPLARMHGYWLYKGFLSRTPHWPLPRQQAWVLEKLKRALVQAYEGRRDAVALRKLEAHRRVLFGRGGLDIVAARRHHEAER